MTFRTIEAANRAASRFDAEYGTGEVYAYRVEPNARGFMVGVYSVTSGAFLTFV